MKIEKKPHFDGLTVKTSRTSNFFFLPVVIFRCWCVCVFFFTYHNFLIFRLQTVINRFDEYACCDGKNSKYLFSEKRNIKEILFWRETLNIRMHIGSCINTILMDKQVKLHTYFYNKTKNWFLVKSTSKWWLRVVVVVFAS